MPMLLQIAVDGIAYRRGIEGQGRQRNGEIMLLQVDGEGLPPAHDSRRIHGKHVYERFDRTDQLRKNGSHQQSADAEEKEQAKKEAEKATETVATVSPAADPKSLEEAERDVENKGEGESDENGKKNGEKRGKDGGKNR